MYLLGKGELHRLAALRRVKGVVDVDIEVGQFGQQSYLPQLDHVPLDERVPKGGSVVGLKIAELLQKPRNLHDDPEDVLIGGVVVHAEALHCLIVLNNRIEALFFQFLPVPAELVLVVRVEQQQEVLDVGHHFFQPEIALCAEEVVGLLL